MTSERNLWTTTRRHLSPHGRLVRVESPLTEAGIPDVSYCLRGHAGWLELKEVAEWPKRATTPLRIPNLELEQVIFMETWEWADGSAHLLLQIEREYLLLSSDVTRGVLERKLTRSDVTTRASAWGRNVFPTAAVVKALTRPRDSAASLDAALGGPIGPPSVLPAPAALAAALFPDSKIARRRREKLTDSEDWA